MLIVIVAVTSAERMLKAEIYEAVKAKASWIAYDINENPFKDYTEEDFKNLFGAKLELNERNIFLLYEEDYNELFHTSFDTREFWPECVSEVKDQLNCGACWAVSASTILADRFCIATGGLTKLVLSAQDMVSCDTQNHECHGGAFPTAWQYLENYGVVTEECFAYVSGYDGQVPHCPHGVCQDFLLKYQKYRAVQGSSKELIGVNAIKREIMTNGPVHAGFFVYEDFLVYQGGIYEYTWGEKKDGHAIKIVGWGVEDGKEYWIVQNSWGPNWGENGYFRIKMGECYIEQFGYAGLPNLEDVSFNSYLW